MNIKTIVRALLLLVCAGCTVAKSSQDPGIFGPTSSPPTCGEEMNQVVTGLATATLDEANSVHAEQAIAIAYSTITVLQKGGTGNIAIWSDHDGYYRWLCKDVNNFVVEMVRNGTGATIKFIPNDEGTVEEFEVIETHLPVTSFSFEFWSSAAL